MATKQVNAISLTIRIEVPIVYPLSVAAAIEWEASGLSEMGGRHASLSGSIPSGSVTIARKGDESMRTLFACLAFSLWPALAVAALPGLPVDLGAPQNYARAGQCT